MKLTETLATKLIKLSGKVFVSMKQKKNVERALGEELAGSD